MHFKQALQDMNSRKSIFLFSVFIFAFSIFLINDLQGAENKTEELIARENTTWNHVFLDLDGWMIAASLPNYSGASSITGASFDKESVVLVSNIENFDYVIAASFKTNVKSPKSLKDFIRIVQEADPDCLVTAVDSINQGAKYAVDVIPVVQENANFKRVLYASNRLIMMKSNDSNEKYRQAFFDSLFIHQP